MNGPHRAPIQLEVVRGPSLMPTLRRAALPGLLRTDAHVLVGLVGLATAYAWTGPSPFLVAPFIVSTAGVAATIATMRALRAQPKSRATVDEDGVLLSIEAGGWARTRWRDVCGARRVGEQLVIQFATGPMVVLEASSSELARVEAMVKANARARRWNPGHWILGVLLAHVALGALVLGTHRTPARPEERVAEAIDRGHTPDERDLEVMIDGDVCARAAVFDVLERAHRLEVDYFPESLGEDAETRAAAWLGSPCDPSELTRIGRVELEDESGDGYEYWVFARRTGGWMAVGPYRCDGPLEPFVTVHDGAWSPMEGPHEVARDLERDTGTAAVGLPLFEPAD